MFFFSRPTIWWVGQETRANWIKLVYCDVWSINTTHITHYIRNKEHSWTEPHFWNKQYIMLKITNLDWVQLLCVTIQIIWKNNNNNQINNKLVAPVISYIHQLNCDTTVETNDNAKTEGLLHCWPLVVGCFFQSALKSNINILGKKNKKTTEAQFHKSSYCI